MIMIKGPTTFGHSNATVQHGQARLLNFRTQSEIGGRVGEGAAAAGDAGYD